MHMVSTIVIYKVYSIIEIVSTNIFDWGRSDHINIVKTIRYEYS